MSGWMDLFRSLGEALLEVLRAEAATLQDDLTRSGRQFGIALALLAGAAAVLFWFLGLLIFVLVAVLAIWLPLWGAALIVLTVFGIVAGILAWRGIKGMRQVENPVETVRRRVDSHLDWWQHSLLTQTRTLDVEPVAGDGEPLGRNLP